MAHQFIDALSRPWVVHLDIGVARKIRKQLNVDVHKIDVFHSIAEDSLLMADILDVVLTPQMEKLGVSKDQLEAAFSGDVIGEATMALLNAIIDFFPPAQREMMRRLLAKGKTVETKLLAAAELKADRELERMERESLAKLEEPEPTIQPLNLSILGDSLQSGQASVA